MDYYLGEIGITNQTAAEIIVNRANENLPNMALTSWKGNVVRKQDIYIAKNYLNETELDSLNRYVSVFLETAELRAKNRQDITMNFWKENVDRILEFTDQKILLGKGSISHEEMEKIIEEVYGKFEQRRKKIDAEFADAMDMEELKAIEDKLNIKK